MQSFFTATQPDCGLTFVVYLHFPPQATSHLVGILAQTTGLPVTAAVHGEAIQPDHVYVVPPGRLAVFAGGAINLSDLNETHHPIDTLFCSLADEYGERAIGVILSGTGRDGTRGIEAISARGGLTMAQGDGGGSSHPEMPASAIATGLVDYVMRVEEIPAHLATYGKGRSSGGKNHAVGMSHHRLKDIKGELCGLLRQTAKHDFSHYKVSTFLRRVGRRMRVLGITDWDAYVDQARRNPNEVILLFRDLLIGVTAFFRDADAFQALATTIIPRLFAGKGPQDIVRVWVPGCSSGEEAYSIAMLLLEHAQTMSAPPQLQVFATDVDEAALRVARSGMYSASAMEGVREDRVERFFTRDSDRFVASRELRTICTFSLHSLIRDPPLCFIDLISCRNLLIYFDRNLQDQVIPTFHFALRPGGILFLGPSESVGRHTDLFVSVDNANRIFEQVASARRSVPFLPPSKAKALSRPDLPVRRAAVAERTIAQLADAQILKRYGPANVVVNARGDIVHFSPRTGKYLEPIPGSPNHNLLAMARKGLRVSLRSALHEAKKSGHMAIHDNIAVELDVGVVQKVQVAVEPLNQDGEGPLWLVTFVDIGSISMGEAGPKDDGSVEADMAIQILEREIQETRESLQTAIDEYEIAIEELRSSNEELMSMNDDLQASNEELEASKEELHVINDELRTVNSDLAAKIEELKQANGDLRNFSENTKIAVIFLDQNLVIRSFTRAVTEMFRLVPNDCGRLLTDIVSYLDCDSLSADIAAAIKNRETVERAVIRRDGGAHYLLRVIPYLTLGGEVDGVLVTLVNVTAAVEAQAQERYHRLLIAELNHRVKNILTVAASLATQTLRNTATAADFTSVFLGRLQALSKAHDLLSNENWSEVPLRALILTGLELQAEDGGRVTLDGPLIRLDAKAATTLSLAFHELATNATKYGAFSNDNGHIHISWAQEVRPNGTVLVIRWRESGGPPVQPPTRKGFGSEMIVRGIKYELRGQAIMDFLPAGLEVEISMPLDGLSPAGPIMRAQHESSE
ncbi:MAG: PAS domain-containing protein [Rhodospirillaceae bacterium]|nr:PAS domain-containing protein [Rhodospirillales bacterium]